MKPHLLKPDHIISSFDRAGQKEYTRSAVQGFKDGQLVVLGMKYIFSILF